MQHRVRDLLIRQRTQAINALRSHLAELGIVAAQSYYSLKTLLSIVAYESDALYPKIAALVCQRSLIKSPPASPRLAQSRSSFSLIFARFRQQAALDYSRHQHHCRYRLFLVFS